MGKTAITLVGGVLVVGLGLLFYATSQGTALVMTPSELLKVEPGGERLRIRVAGKVAAQEIRYTIEPQIELRFYIKDPGKPAAEVEKQVTAQQSMSSPEAMAAMQKAMTQQQDSSPQPSTAAPESETGLTIPVVYRKLKPDMFAAGRDVIIDGNFRNGTLEAVNLMTQCPSKYEPPHPSNVDYSKSGSPSQPGDSSGQPSNSSGT